MVASLLSPLSRPHFLFPLHCLFFKLLFPSIPISTNQVHERSIESDFLLMVLRDLLVKRPSLRIILMSATLDADLFHRYFGGAPSVKFPGRTFPVTELYLEHAMELTQHQVCGRAWILLGNDRIYSIQMNSSGKDNPPHPPPSKRNYM